MSPAQEISLARRDVIRLRGPVTMTLYVRKGRVWITHEGCREDFFVSAHESLVLSGRQVVIEAEEDCALEWYRPRVQLSARLKQWLWPAVVNKKPRGLSPAGP